LYKSKLKAASSEAVFVNVEEQLVAASCLLLDIERNRSLRVYCVDRLIALL
jgi:hypothetical protein